MFFKRKLSFSSRKLVHIFGGKYSFLLGHHTATVLGNSSKRVPYLIQCRLKYPSFFRMGHQHQCRTFLHFCRPCANLFSRASRVLYIHMTNATHLQANKNDLELQTQKGFWSYFVQFIKIALPISNTYFTYQ